MDFKTHVDEYGGDETNNQAGGEIDAEIAAPTGIENEANTSSTPKPIYITIPPRTKGRFAITQNGRNKNHLSPLLDYPTTLLLILTEPAADIILLVTLPLLRIL